MCGVINLMTADAMYNKERTTVRQRGYSGSSKYDLNIDSLRRPVLPITEWTWRKSRGYRRVKYDKNPSGMGPRWRFTLSGRS